MTGFSGDYKREKTGEVRKWLFWSVPMWEYRSDWPHPLTYTCANGDRLQPDRHLKQSDGMSSPPFLWHIDGLAQTDFPKSVYFHDSATRYGGMYVNGFFKTMTMKQVNDLLYFMVLAEGGTKGQASRIYFGVSLGMPFVWDEKRQRVNRIEDGVANA